jgi:chemotaxis protein CheX
MYEEVLKAIIDRAESFIGEDMGIEVLDKDICANFCEFELLECMTIIGLGGDINALTIFSFETSLVDKLAESFIYGEVTKEEKAELFSEIPAEVANTVLGNAIPNFPNSGKGATITPPIIIEDARLARKLKDSSVLTARLKTKYGNVQCALLN